MTTTFDLERFVQAQAESYPRALDELRAGRKQSHWMWYVFPQLRGLGRSAMAERYGITSLDDARAYLNHPILGTRLLECSTAILSHRGKPVRDILGTPDDLKLRSCATLFALVAAPDSGFEQILAEFYSGGQDPVTLSLLGMGG